MKVYELWVLLSDNEHTLSLGLFKSREAAEDAWLADPREGPNVEDHGITEREVD